MKKRLKEQGIIFYSVLRWVLLSVIAGCLVGVSTAVFLKSLGWSISLAESQRYYYLLLPLALFGSAWLIRKLAPDAEGHGTEKVIEAKKSKLIDIELGQEINQVRPKV